MAYDVEQGQTVFPPSMIEAIQWNFEFICGQRDEAWVAYQNEVKDNEELRKELDSMMIRYAALQDDYMRELQEKQRIRETIAVPNTILGPTQKLMVITAPWQVSYSAAAHGGDAEIKLTSIARWRESIGVGVNTINNNMERLESLGIMKRAEHNLEDGHKHYSLEIDWDMVRNPAQIVQATPKELERKNNGGNKRCPQCGGYCKRKMRTVVYYECGPCGLDFDSEMRPFDHSAEFVKGIS